MKPITVISSTTCTACGHPSAVLPVVRVRPQGAGRHRAADITINTPLCWLCFHAATVDNVVGPSFWAGIEKAWRRPADRATALLRFQRLARPLVGPDARLVRPRMFPSPPRRPSPREAAEAFFRRPGK